MAPIRQNMEPGEYRQGINEITAAMDSAQNNTTLMNTEINNLISKIDKLIPDFNKVKQELDNSTNSHKSARDRITSLKTQLTDLCNRREEFQRLLAKKEGKPYKQSNTCDYSNIVVPPELKMTVDRDGLVGRIKVYIDKNGLEVRTITNKNAPSNFF